MLFNNVLFMTDTLRFKMMQKFTQVKAVVADGRFAAT